MSTEQTATSSRQLPAQFTEQIGKHPPWQKGMSGNPGGKPKKNRDIVAECRDMTPMILRKLKNIVKCSPSEKNAVAASTVLLAYGWGRPSTKLIIETPGNDGENLLALADTDDLKLILELRQRLLGKQAALQAENVVDGEFTRLEDSVDCGDVDEGGCGDSEDSSTLKADS